MAKKRGAFERKARQIARKKRIPVKNARRILAVGARRASAKAVRKNPGLRRVAGNKRNRRGQRVKSRKR